MEERRKEMLAYGITNKNGSIAVDQNERLIIFRLKKCAQKIKLNKGEKIVIFEVRPPLDGRIR